MRNTLRLEAGISVVNYVMSQFHILSIVLIFLVMETMKVKLIHNKDSFGYSKEKGSKTISMLFIEETVVKTLFFPLFGYLNDIIGRKRVAAIGYSIVVLNLFLIS